MAMFNVSGCWKWVTVMVAFICLYGFWRQHNCSPMEQSVVLKVPTGSSERNVAQPKKPHVRLGDHGALTAIRERVNNALSETSPGEKDIVKIHRAWGRFWSPGFDVPLESGSVSAVATGKLAPPEILSHINDETSLAELFAKGKVDFIIDNNELETTYSLMLIASLACMKGGAQIPAFLDRAGIVPPTRGDLVIFRVFNDALGFLETPTALDPANFDGWRRMETAANPVYRLMAARMFHLVSNDLQQQSEFYRALLSDSDPAILRIAVRAASRFSTQETLGALSEFKDRQTQLGNIELADQAEKAMLSLPKGQR